MKAQNCTHSWSAGIWADDCFLAYSVSNFSSAFEEGFRRLNFTTVGDDAEYPRFFEREELENLGKSVSLLSHDATTSSGAAANTTTRGTSRVRALAHCAGDRERDCTHCVGDSALYLEECEMHGDYECPYLDGTHAGVAAVLGFNCYLRLEISPPTSQGDSLRLLFLYNLIGLVVYATMM